MMRRADDRKELIRTLFGAALVLFGIAAKFLLPHSTDWFIVAVLVIGAGLVSPSFVVDLVKAARAPSP